MRLKSLSELLTPPRGFGLTKSGRIFFIFLFAIIVTAMATGNNLLFLILACLLAFMIVSGIESEMNIRHLDIDRVIPAEIYARRPGGISFTIRNKKMDCERLVLSEGKRPAPPGRAMKLAFLSRGVPEVLRQEKVFPRRGRYRLGTVVVSTTYPYGLFMKSISFDLDDEVLVFPEPVFFEGLASCGPAGEHKGRERDSLSHVRPYSPGDPLSAVAWKKQRQGFISRVFQGGGGVGALIVVRPGGDMEQKLGMATYLVMELWKSDREFGLSINSYFSGMGTSGEHKLQILRTLADIDSIGEPLRRDFPGNGHVIHI